MVSQRFHEVRDPIHDFVKLDSDERIVLDSLPVQRLRHIHQLAMSYLVYPGATHRRFEHSLGVMELAGRVFDVVTAWNNGHQAVREVYAEIQGDRKSYWRKVLRMAALCHDIGHLPFSHAAEHELLPDDWNHERLTVKFIRGDLMEKVWRSMRPPLNPDDVAKVAVGPKDVAKEMGDTVFSNWELLLSEIISGDALGVDRMDYLLRDSHHAGVAYGRFDHYRLIDTMRILPESEESDAPTLGIEIGGIHSAEALLLARYFMFMQVYHHRVRMAYDLHLEEFLSAWLPSGQFPVEELDLQRLTDNEVLHEISQAAINSSAPGHIHAARIANRNHFRPVYITTLADRENHDDPLTTIFKACVEKYGEDSVRQRKYTQTEPVAAFPVVDSQESVVSSHSVSEPLRHIPFVDVGIVLMDSTLVSDARDWLRAEKETILSDSAEGE